VRRILVICTRPDDSFAQELAKLQAVPAEHQVNIIHLKETGADYDQLLQTIFESDSVQVY